MEVIAPDYEGFGPWFRRGLKLGLGTVLTHHSAFKRIAVVSDKEWVAHTLHRSRDVPGELAVFGLDELVQPRSGGG